MRQTNRKATAGSRAEASARRFLEKQGLQFCASNYRSRFGEIDLVMRDGETVVFVEVRLRSHPGFGSAAGSVTASKQRKLAHTAAIYLERQSLGHHPVRFDIVTFDGTGATPGWLKGAFRPEF